jgi:hypothetical protein
MKCALCETELKGFADGVMVERRVRREKLWRVEKVLVCRDDDECGNRRRESNTKTSILPPKPHSA